jgi:hypothetical protein
VIKDSKTGGSDASWVEAGHGVKALLTSAHHNPEVPKHGVARLKIYAMLNFSNGST